MKYIYFFVLISFGLSSCVKNNPLPVYLEINKWTFNSNPVLGSDQGELTHNFSDVWVYIDGKVIGVFELPCKVPVLVSGNCKITLYPTIRNNGVASNKKIYPFVSEYETTLDLTAGETYTLDPVTQYLSNTHFFIEDFEGSSVSLERDASVSTPNLEMNVENNNTIGLWGSYGHLALAATDDLWVGVLPAMALPKSGREVYLEFDYRNTNSIGTGMTENRLGGTQYDHGGYTVSRQSPSDLKWKRIYMDLKEVVSNTPNGISYEQYLRVLMDEDLNSSDVYIDNIKIIYLF